MDRFQGQAEVEDQQVAATPREVFELARVRRTELELDYAGAVTPPEAWQLVQQNAAVLIDVRTAPEFKFVGRVPGTANVEWHGRDEGPRARFLELLSAAADREEAVLLICRSGVRSHAAASAAAAAGFGRVYNVLEGFEGQIDAHRQRGKVNGWRFAGLPWEQD
jgi:rhodanese-related sulfurtransferase